MHCFLALTLISRLSYGEGIIYIFSLNVHYQLGNNSYRNTFHIEIRFSTKKILEKSIHVGNNNAIYYTKTLLACSVLKTFSIHKKPLMQKKGYWRKVKAKKSYTKVILFQRKFDCIYFLKCCSLLNFFCNCFLLQWNKSWILKHHFCNQCLIPKHLFFKKKC